MRTLRITSEALKNGQRQVALTAVLPVALLFLVRYLDAYLYFVMPKNPYLWTHTILEIWSIVVAYTIFSLAWYSGPTTLGRRALWAGSGFIAIFLIDLFHTLSFPGMPDFITANINDKSIYLWLAGRLVFVGVVIISSFLRDGQPGPKERWVALLTYLGISAFFLLRVLSGQTPRFFIEGEGLTPLKIGVEWGLVVLMILAAWRHYQIWRARGEETSLYIVRALSLSVASELCFTLYASESDTYNLLGHLFQIGTYWFIFQGFFVLSVRKPYDDLARAYAQLQQSHRLTILGRMSGRLHHDPQCSHLGKGSSSTGKAHQ